MARWGRSRYYGRSRYHGGGSSYGGWAPYVPVAERRANALKKVASLQKKGRAISPVKIEGRTIATTFWGKAWCENLEGYSDYENRLPRGRTYVRNGSVVDLQIEPGKVASLVSGSDIYSIEIGIRPLEPQRWKSIRKECAGGIDSLVELLQGRFSNGVMEVITRKGTGLFPAPAEISMKCSCPDWATMCKHVAATLYGVGARLDEMPELLFRLRGVDHTELIQAAGEGAAFGRVGEPASGKVLDASDLSGIFGIELDAEASPRHARAAKAGRAGKKAVAPAPANRPASGAKAKPKRKAAASPKARATRRPVGKKK